MARTKMKEIEQLERYFMRTRPNLIELKEQDDGSYGLDPPTTKAGTAQSPEEEAKSTVIKIKIRDPETTNASSQSLDGIKRNESRDSDLEVQV